MFKKIRFWLAKFFINCALSVIDKNSIEAVSFMLCIKQWIEYLNSVEAQQIREKQNETKVN